MLSEVDQALRAALAEAEADDPTVWSCPDRDPHESAHSLFQYPAMMVPEVQRRLVHAVHSVQAGVKSVFDPFVGAATSLVAAMSFGLDCHGCDINPLAILVSSVKTDPLPQVELEGVVALVLRRAGEDHDASLDATFPGQDKWFKPTVAVELSRLRRAIQAVQCIRQRRFLWVCLAETVRLTSNDRTSTFKLHARPQGEIENRNPSPLASFADIAAQSVRDVEDHRRLLEERGRWTGTGYCGEVSLHLGDSATLAVEPDRYDLLVTSPPYGDNATTVTYGQHSYLPLQWIDLADIHPAADASCLRTTHEIDYRSLGGKVSIRELARVAEPLRARSPSIGATLDALADHPDRLAAKIAVFYRDLDRVLGRVVQMMKPNAYMLWTVGNRRVGGLPVPTDDILCQLLDQHNVAEVGRLGRDIHFKRMPTRNSASDTMAKETILILRKRAAQRGDA